MQHTRRQRNRSQALCCVYRSGLLGALYNKLALELAKLELLRDGNLPLQLGAILGQRQRRVERGDGVGFVVVIRQIAQLHRRGLDFLFRGSAPPAKVFLDRRDRQRQHFLAGHSTPVHDHGAIAVPQRGLPALGAARDLLERDDVKSTANLIQQRQKLAERQESLTVVDRRTARALTIQLEHAAGSVLFRAFPARNKDSPPCTAAQIEREQLPRTQDAHFVTHA